jgi:hypothetical protein
MSQLLSNRRHIWLAVASSIAAFGLFAGCAGTPATNAPAPAATGSIIDTFTRKVTAADFQASGHFSGSMSFQLGSVSEKIDVSGPFQLLGADNSFTMNESVDGKSTTISDIVVDGSIYESQDAGAWVQQQAPPGDRKIGVSALLQGLSLSDKGSGFFGDQYARLLQSTDSVDPLEIYLGSSNITDSDLHLAFWVKDDGTPVGMIVSGSWTETSSETTFNPQIELDFTFDSFTGVAIVAPSAAPAAPKSPVPSLSPSAKSS